MSKYVSSTLAAALLALAALAAVPRATAEAQQPLSLDQLMSPQERAATGIAKLTPAERAALEAWLARYTATVSAVARGLGPAQQAQPATPAAPPGQAAEPAPAAPRSPFVEPPKLPATAPVGAHVFRASDGGTFVMLRDGTVWEIFHSDRPAATVWQAGDFVQVQRRHARVGEFDYQLVNATRSRRVTARFAGFVQIEESGRN